MFLERGLEPHQKNTAKELGDVNAVHPKTLGGKVVYFVGCPYSTCCYGSDRVETNLMGKKHNWKERDAKLFKS